MQDQIIGETMARSIQAAAERKHPLLAWVITQDEGTYHGQFVARLLTNAPTPYVLLADTLGELHAQLPPGTRWSDRGPADPPEVVAIWFLPTTFAPTPTQSPSSAPGDSLASPIIAGRDGRAEGAPKEAIP
jgi:hypothetical protein